MRLPRRLATTLNRTPNPARSGGEWATTPVFRLGSVAVARGFSARTIGLIGKKRATPLLFPQCWAIHTFFMAVPVDVLFLDANDVIVKVWTNVGPWRVMVGGRRTASILEMPGGWLRRNGLQVGDRLEYVEQPAAGRFPGSELVPRGRRPLRLGRASSASEAVSSSRPPSTGSRAVVPANRGAKL